MSERATGGVYKRGRVFWCDYRVDGKRFFESTGTADRRMAQSFLAQRRREIAEGTWAPPNQRSAPSVLTVRQYLEEWIARRRGAGIRTVSDEERRLLTHVVPDIGHMALADVKRTHVRDLMAKVARARSTTTDGALAPRTQLHVYRTLATAFADARDDELIASTPCTLRTRKGELPVKRDKDPKWRAEAVYTRDECETLIADQRVPPDRRAWYALALLGGMRSGEVNARRWRDIETAKPLAKMTIATQADDDGERETKTTETRECPVHPTLAALLDDWRRIGFPMLYGRHAKPDDLIVPSRADGRSFRSKKMLERLREDLQRVGLRQVPAARHAMRATFLSLLEVDGANMAIARRATHAAPQDVVGGYVRVRWEDVCREVAKLRIEWRTLAKVIALPLAANDGTITARGDSLGDSQPAGGDFLDKKSGVDGTRTRGLRRDRPAL